MATRMREMASGVASALESGAEKLKHSPPLALQYQYAVERREARDTQAPPPSRMPSGVGDENLDRNYAPRTEITRRLTP